MPFERQSRASQTKKKGGDRTCSSSLLTRTKIRKLYFGRDDVCCVLFFFAYKSSSLTSNILILNFTRSFRMHDVFSVQKSPRGRGEFDPSGKGKT
jgi:hypothetical protein